MSTPETNHTGSAVPTGPAVATAGWRTGAIPRWLSASLDRIVYRLLYVVGQLALAQYFRSIRRVGISPPEHGPIVIVANHFNGLLDALLVAGSFWRPCSITAKSTLFVGWSGRLLARLPAIPVHRPIDGDRQQNARMFRHVSRVLLGGGAVVVFPYEIPQDYVAGERRLYKFKTGAVRMAFEAEKAAGRDLGVRILPVGINYADFQAVGTSATLVFGEPVRARDFMIQADDFQAVRECVEEVDARLRKLVVEMPREAYAEFAELVDHLWAQENDDDFVRLGAVARQVRAMAPLHPELVARFGTRIQRYLALCEGLGLPPGAEALPLRHRWRILAAAPLTVWGWFWHYLPTRVLAGLARRLTKDPYYVGTIQFLLGFVGFPLWYALLAGLFYLLVPNRSWLIATLVLTALSGWIVNRFGFRLNLLLATLLPSRRARHLANLREQGAELRDALRIILADEPRVSIGHESP